MAFNSVTTGHESCAQLQLMKVACNYNLLRHQIIIQILILQLATIFASRNIITFQSLQLVIITAGKNITNISSLPTYYGQ